MNSRNHIMFGAPGEWVYLCVLEPGGRTAFRSHSNSFSLTHPARGGRYGAGLTQTNTSIGFEHALFRPPAKLLAAGAGGCGPCGLSAASTWPSTAFVLYFLGLSNAFP